MAGRFGWISPPTCEGGGFGESLSHQTLPRPRASSRRRAHQGQENLLATGYQPPWVLLDKFTFRTEIGIKPSAQSYPHSREQQGQESGGWRSAMGLSQNHLSLHSPSCIQAPPAPVALGAVPQPQGFLWKVTGSSREYHPPGHCCSLCRVLKYPGRIPACHSRAVPLGSRTAQPAFLAAISGAAGARNYSFLP